MPITQNDLDWIDLHLASAVYYLNRKHRMSAHDINQGLASIPAVTNEKPRMPTISEQIKAAKADMIAVREHAATVAVETRETVRIVKAEVDKALKEAADLRAEVADITNGGPL